MSKCTWIHSSNSTHPSIWGSAMTVVLCSQTEPTSCWSHEPYRHSRRLWVVCLLSLKGGFVIAVSLCVCVPEQPDAKTDHDVVEWVETHHAHQQILQNNLQRRKTCSVMMPCRHKGEDLRKTCWVFFKQHKFLCWKSSVLLETLMNHLNIDFYLITLYTVSSFQHVPNYFILGEIK